MYNKLIMIAMVFIAPIVLFALLALAAIGGDGMFIGIEKARHT